MAFSVEDFHDLVRLLDQHPEWRAELRRLMLAEELLGLPADVAELRQIVAELAAAQRQSTFELRELRQSITELREIVAGHTRELAQLRESIVELAEVQRQSTRESAELRSQFSAFQGSELERRYRDRAGAYFARVVRRPRLISQQQLANLHDKAEDAGQLSAEERDDVMLADVVVRGRRQLDDAEVYLVVEVSIGVGVSDVERAVRRASLLGRLAPALAAVAGERIVPEADALADTQGVWRVLNGHVTAPGEG